MDNTLNETLNEIANNFYNDIKLGYKGFCQKYLVDVFNYGKIKKMKTGFDIDELKYFNEFLNIPNIANTKTPLYGSGYEEELKQVNSELKNIIFSAIVKPDIKFSELSDNKYILSFIGTSIDEEKLLINITFEPDYDFEKMMNSIDIDYDFRSFRIEYFSKWGKALKNKTHEKFIITDEWEDTDYKIYKKIFEPNIRIETKFNREYKILDLPPLRSYTNFEITKFDYWFSFLAYYVLYVMFYALYILWINIIKHYIYISEDDEKIHELRRLLTNLCDPKNKNNLTKLYYSYHETHITRIFTAIYSKVFNAYESVKLTNNDFFEYISNSGMLTMKFKDYDKGICWLNVLTLSISKYEIDNITRGETVIYALNKINDFSEIEERPKDLVNIITNLYKIPFDIVDDNTMSDMMYYKRMVERTYSIIAMRLTKYYFDKDFMFEVNFENLFKNRSFEVSSFFNINKYKLSECCCTIDGHIMFKIYDSKKHKIYDLNSLNKYYEIEELPAISNISLYEFNYETTIIGNNLVDLFNSYSEKTKTNIQCINIDEIDINDMNDIINIYTIPLLNEADKSVYNSRKGIIFINDNIKNHENKIYKCKHENVEYTARLIIYPESTLIKYKEKYYVYNVLLIELNIKDANSNTIIPILLVKNCQNSISINTIIVDVIMEYIMNGCKKMKLHEEKFMDYEKYYSYIYNNGTVNSEVYELMQYITIGDEIIFDFIIPSEPKIKYYGGGLNENESLNENLNLDSNENENKNNNKNNIIVYILIFGLIIILIIVVVILILKLKSKLNENKNVK